MQHQLVLLYGLLCHAQVVGGINAADILLGVGGRKIKAGIDQRRVERDRLLEVINGLLELIVLEGLHTLVELVARLQLVAAGAEQQQ